MIQLTSRKIILLVVVCLCITLGNIGFQLFRRNDISDRRSYLPPEEDAIEIIYDDFSEQIKDANALLNGQIEGIVYFGRDTCPNCIQLNAALKQYAEDNRYRIYKFDTDNFRNAEEFDAILEKYSVDSIPMLVELDSAGNVRSRFAIDDNEMKNYLKLLDDFFKNLTDSISK